MAKFVSLDKYIELVDVRNSDGALGASSVMGVSTNKGFIETKANLTDVSLLPYKVVAPRQFAYVADTSRRGDNISLGFNDSQESYIVSTWYVVFRVVNEEELLPEYLYLWFCRSEFDRYARANSWGSAREYFWLDEMKRVRVPLPSIEEQQAIVDAWKSLQKVQEQNEALAVPLLQLCQSYIQECKHEYPMEELRKHIKEVNEKNTEEVYGVDDVRGLSTSKDIIPTKANLDGVSVKSYKIFRPEQFAFVDDTSRRGDKMSLAVNMSKDTYIVSGISTIVEIIDKDILLPQFLKLWFDRSEFDRYARFHSWGSARESFTYEDMQRVKVPLPPKDVQSAIVSLYQCALEYKAVAAGADAQARSICSALMQHAINN